MTNRPQRGATTVEMALVGLPIIFVLISIFEISRGMWMYHTLAHSVKEGVRYAMVHGQNCVNDPTHGYTNNCAVSAADIAAKMKDAGVGLDTSRTKVKFFYGGVSAPQITCTLAGVGTNCATNPWPPNGFNGIGSPIEIDVITPFNSALALFWPGSPSVSFAVVNFGASSSDRIQF